jgi:hypothetical protein
MKNQKYLYSVTKENVWHVFLHHSAFNPVCLYHTENVFIINSYNIRNTIVNLQCPICSYEFHIGIYHVDMCNPKILVTI